MAALRGASGGRVATPRRQRGGRGGAEPARAYRSNQAAPDVPPHGIEADALTAAMREMRGRGVLALPLHDALIVPVSAAESAKSALGDAYERVAGIRPHLTAKLPGDVG